MTFNSAIFLIFVAIFFTGWRLLDRNIQAKWIFLTFSSFFFYGWWNWYFLALLIGTGTLDFLLGRTFEYTRTQFQRRLLLIVSIVTNLGILFSFKYSVFFAKNLDRILAQVGIDSSLATDVPEMFLILPIGISFYTFESLSYIIDVYRGHIKPTRNYFHFFAFLSMFPRLVAGPIERPANLLPQLLHCAPATKEMRWTGTTLIAQGFFKKTVIADNLAPFVNWSFASNLQLSSLHWWLTMAAFSIQIYCDFSGYSDIARGLANWMGFEFKLNFNHPYRALGFSDFWKRWHISLSSWFRDYVYIPLGGDRKGAMRNHVNLWITMLLSGFWHGAQWTFVIWGAFHAFLLSTERIFRWPSYFNSPFKHVIGVLITYALATTAWVFFRATSLSQATHILKRLYIPTPGEIQAGKGILLLLAVAFVMEVLPVALRFWKKEAQILSFAHPLQRAYLIVLLALTVYARGPGSTFIYFQF